MVFFLLFNIFRFFLKLDKAQTHTNQAKTSMDQVNEIKNLSSIQKPFVNIIFWFGKMGLYSFITSICR